MKKKMNIFIYLLISSPPYTLKNNVNAINKRRYGRDYYFGKMSKNNFKIINRYRRTHTHTQKRCNFRTTKQNKAKTEKSIDRAL